MNRAELSKQIKIFMRRAGLTQVDLAQKMNVSQPIMSEMINGKRRAVRVVEYLNTNYSTNFAVPEEDMLYSDVHQVERDEPKPYTTSKNGTKYFEENGRIYMEVVKVERNALGSMGDDYAPMTMDRENVATEQFEVDGVHHGEYICFEVDGDSMDDGTGDGFRRRDVVLVRNLDKSHWDNLHYKQWPYWVVVFGNNVRLKQIIAQEGDTITLHSLNPSPEYTDFTLKLSDVTHLYNVVQQKRTRKFGV